MGYANLTVLLEEYRISPLEGLVSVCDLDTITIKSIHNVISYMFVNFDIKLVWFGLHACLFSVIWDN